MSILQYHNIYEKKSQQIPLDFSISITPYPHPLPSLPSFTSSSSLSRHQNLKDSGLFPESFPVDFRWNIGGFPVDIHRGDLL